MKSMELGVPHPHPAGMPGLLEEAPGPLAEFGLRTDPQYIGCAVLGKSIPFLREGGNLQTSRTERQG